MSWSPNEPQDSVAFSPDLEILLRVTSLGLVAFGLSLSWFLLGRHLEQARQRRTLQFLFSPMETPTVLALFVLFLSAGYFVFCVIAIHGVGLSFSDATCSLAVFVPVGVMTVAGLGFYALLAIQVRAALGRSVLFRLFIIFLCLALGAGVGVATAMGHGSNVNQVDGQCSVFIRREIIIPFLGLDLLVSSSSITALAILQRRSRRASSKRTLWRRIVAVLVSLVTTALNLGLLLLFAPHEYGWAFLLGTAYVVLAHGILSIWLAASSPAPSAIDVVTLDVIEDPICPWEDDEEKQAKKQRLIARGPLSFASKGRKDRRGSPFSVGMDPADASSEREHATNSLPLPVGPDPSPSPPRILPTVSPSAISTIAPLRLPRHGSLRPKRTVVPTSNLAAFHAETVDPLEPATPTSPALPFHPYHFPLPPILPTPDSPASSTFSLARDRILKDAPNPFASSEPNLSHGAGSHNYHYRRRTSSAGRQSNDIGQPPMERYAPAPMRGILKPPPRKSPARARAASLAAKVNQTVDEYKPENRQESLIAAEVSTSAQGTPRSSHHDPLSPVIDDSVFGLDEESRW